MSVWSRLRPELRAQAAAAAKAAEAERRRGAIFIANRPHVVVCRRCEKRSRYKELATAKRHDCQTIGCDGSFRPVACAHCGKDCIFHNETLKQ